MQSNIALRYFCHKKCATCCTTTLILNKNTDFCINKDNAKPVVRNMRTRNDIFPINAQVLH